MTDPKKPMEPQRTSQPQTPPDETPSHPGTEYEKNVPHTPEQPVAMSGESGEGSYQGTREYLEGYERFSESHSPEETVREAKKINPDDPKLKEAEPVCDEAGRYLD